MGLAARLVDWMAANRDGLDPLMAEEGSRAVHEEFLMAEGGSLPDRADRIERARAASARAWMRHLGRGLAQVWAGADSELPSRLERWTAAHPERLEALVLEEDAVAERRGLSGDPQADRRDVELAAHCRMLAEALAAQADSLGHERPPEFSRRVAAWARSQGARRRRLEDEACSAWSSGSARPPGAATPAPGADELRVREAAAVWAHVRVLAEALEHALGAPPASP
jgi:hypothetical protein